MDFVIEDELDYEEDLPVNDLLKINSESVNCSENGMKQDINLIRCEEDCLQINCSEEEEKFVCGERLSETVDSEIIAKEVAEVQKGVGKKQETKKQKIGVEQCTQTTPLNDLICRNRNGNRKRVRNRKTRRSWSYPRRPPKRGTLTKSLTRNPWLPECSFSCDSDMVKPTRATFHNNPLLLPHRNSHISRKLVLPLTNFHAVQLGQNFGAITAGNKTFVNSNSPNVRDNVASFRRGFSECKTGDDIINVDKNFSFGDFEYNFSLNNKEFEKTSLIEKTVDVIKQNPKNITQNFRPCAEDHGNIFKVSHLQSEDNFHSRQFGRKFEVQNAISFLSTSRKSAQKLTVSKDDEKELMRLKKEARLKRFMNDVIIKTEKKPFQLNVDKNSLHCLLGPDDYSISGERLIKEEKLLRREFQIRESTNFNNDYAFLLEKPNLKKELLLKKRNPFDSKIEITNCISGETEIKKEVLWNENLKVEYPKSPLLKAANLKKQFVENDVTKVLESACFGASDLYTIKKETDSRVKFVRTITKNLDELGFKKLKTGATSGSNEEFPLLFKPPFVRGNYQEEMRPQLTGCVVKVLNIPPTTTTNEILSLCSHIGIVKEVKLNFPKENSVVIRFADPTSAENFFSVYHGQKMNNYFLNVIVI